MEDLAICGSIREKISWARVMHEKGEKSWLRHAEVEGLFEDLRQAIERSGSGRKAAGLAQICRDCEEVEGGSCCGAGIENRYDGYVMLINLALGARLPAERWEANSCFFLSREGCCLKARHVICINYVCKNIQDHMDPGTLARLRELEGEEINLLFRVHERIKKILRNSEARAPESQEWMNG
jgi:hypothetical protein